MGKFEITAMASGETFTQALMGRIPHVTQIGESTQVCSSMSWAGGFPTRGASGCNEVFWTPEGATFDGTGILPCIAVPVFAVEDTTAGKDTVMAKALQLLSHNQRRGCTP